MRRPLTSRRNALDVEMAEADGGKYQWNQDSDTVTVEVPVPEGTQGKDVTVAIEAASLRVEVSGRRSDRAKQRGRCAKPC